MPSFRARGALTPGEVTVLPDEEAKHAERVLRLRPGDEICLLDGLGGRYAGVMEAGGAARVGEALPSNECAARVTLYQGIPKADKLETVTQKLTELGAAGVVPVKMSRCVAKLDARDGKKKQERLEKIAWEAVKQCRRALPPVISEPITMRELLARKHELMLVPWEDAKGLTLKKVHEETPDARDIAIVIGPEGGMSAEEVGLLAEAGARVVTLGPRILRTETAAVASVTMAMTLWGDL